MSAELKGAKIDHLGIAVKSIAEARGFYEALGLHVTHEETVEHERVKTAMLNDPAVGGLRIDVDTFKGVVTLSGRVKSQAERERAAMLARGISGVVEVKDSLQVIPESNP